MDNATVKIEHITFAKDDMSLFMCPGSVIRPQAGAKGSPKDAPREYSTHNFTIMITALNNFVLINRFNVVEIHCKVEEKSLIFIYLHLFF